MESVRKKKEKHSFCFLFNSVFQTTKNEKEALNPI